MLEKNVRSYLNAIGASAIFIIIDEHKKPFRIGVARNLDTVTRALFGGKQFGWRAWGNNYNVMEEICRTQRIMLGKDGKIVELPELIERIRKLADAQAIILTEHEIVVSRARAMSVRIDDVFRQLNKSGALKAFNVAYKAHRIREKKEGRNIEPYYVALGKLKNCIVRSIATNKLNYMEEVYKAISRDFSWYSGHVVEGKQSNNN